MESLLQDRLAAHGLRPRPGFLAAKEAANALRQRRRLAAWLARDVPIATCRPSSGPLPTS